MRFWRGSWEYGCGRGFEGRGGGLWGKRERGDGCGGGGEDGERGEEKDGRA